MRGGWLGPAEEALCAPLVAHALCAPPRMHRLLAACSLFVPCAGLLPCSSASPPHLLMLDRALLLHCLPPSQTPASPPLPPTCTACLPPNPAPPHLLMLHRALLRRLLPAVHLLLHRGQHLGTAAAWGKGGQAHSVERCGMDQLAGLQSGLITPCPHKTGRPDSHSQQTQVGQCTLTSSPT